MRDGKNKPCVRIQTPENWFGCCSFPVEALEKHMSCNPCIRVVSLLSYIQSSSRQHYKIMTLSVPWRIYICQNALFAGGGVLCYYFLQMSCWSSVLPPLFCYVTPARSLDRCASKFDSKGTWLQATNTKLSENRTHNGDTWQWNVSKEGEKKEWQ